MLVITYVHVTVLPTAMFGPGAVSASSPFVAFSILIPGLITSTVAVLLASRRAPELSYPCAVPVFVTSAVGLAVDVYTQVSPISSTSSSFPGLSAPRVTVTGLSSVTVTFVSGSSPLLVTS